MQTFREAKHLADEKMLDRQMPLWVNTRVQASDRQQVGVVAGVIEQADAALYHAKQTGRNKTALSEARGVLKTAPLVTAPIQLNK